MVGIYESDIVAANRVSAWNCRGRVDDLGSGGRVVTIKWGDHNRRIGIDGSSEAIKDAIRSAFGLRTRRPFWLEDSEGIVRTIDRDMPLKDYILHLDGGLNIKVLLYNPSNDLPNHAEEKTFYVEDDFHDFLLRHGFIALKGLNCCKSVRSIDDLHPGEVYQGLRPPGS
uniref:GT-1/4-like C-terminal domain-containing protein n=1 Tax=Opuntia streptacantha TaxID=393608 RepID=A0A7C8ZTK5_OPUST